MTEADSKPDSIHRRIPFFLRRLPIPFPTSFGAAPPSGFRPGNEAQPERCDLSFLLAGARLAQAPQSTLWSASGCRPSLESYSELKSIMWRSGNRKLCHATIRLEQGCNGLISPGSVKWRECRPTLAGVSVGDLSVPSEISSTTTAGGIPSCLKRRDDGPQRHPRPSATTGRALQHHGASSVLDSILCSLPSASSRKPLDAKCLPSLPVPVPFARAASWPLIVPSLACS
jgi:hypothetical protein